MNILVGQSGGPTAVINSSLAGVIESAKSRGADKIYGMRNGIVGLLDEKLVLLSEHFGSPLRIELLKRTPSSYLGSCRFKLPDASDETEIYDRIFSILQKYEIDQFFYIGGNDSMDTIAKLSNYAVSINSPIRFIGVPKTIDNDLLCTDHTPGYPSAAKYIAVVMKELIRDATVYTTPSVLIVEIMGRNAGWLAASASLAKSEDCDGVDMIYLPEIPFNMEDFLSKIKEIQKRKPSVVIAVSEGIKTSDGRYVCELSNDLRNVDVFGHTSLSGTAYFLSNVVARELKVKSRAVELSTLQRCAGHLTSRTDISEAYQVGGAAVKAACEGETGKIIGIQRISNDPYQSVTQIVDVHKVANFEKKVPLEWIADDGISMLPAFLQYARPLIQAELPPIFVDGLVTHINTVENLQ